MPLKFHVRCIAFLSPFGRTQRAVCGGKSGKTPEIPHLFFGINANELTAMKNCVSCYGELATISGKVNV
jgi:hypothetical protein